MATQVENSAELTPTEAALMCGRSEWTILRWVKDGKLSAVRRLNRIYLRRADVEKLLTGSPVQPARKK
jgi:excisionase family DNA binding protein